MHHNSLKRNNNIILSSKMKQIQKDFSATCRRMAGFSFAVLAVILLGNNGNAQEDKKPNILFIWTDQQNFGMLSSEGNPYIKTPNLDRLAANGVMFNRAFCTYPSCSPSRATVVTGAYSFNHRMYDNIRPQAGFEGLKPMDGYKIADQYLYENGYRIAHRGKWHIGRKSDWGNCFTSDAEYSEAYSPLWNKLYKKEVAKTYPWDKETQTGSGDYVYGKTPEPTRLTPSWKTVFGQKEIPDWGIVGELLLPVEKTLEYSIIDQTIDFIVANKNKTWMATLSLSPPHDPWIVPEPYFSKMAQPLMAKMKIEGNSPEAEQRSSQSWKVGNAVGDEGIRDYMAIYHAQVVMMDDFIGRVLKKLDELRLTDNTLIIFTSDHGHMLGMHRNVGKINNNLYNRLYHTPCIISYPAKIKGGRKLDNPVMHTDFMPTILDYAGIVCDQKSDGKSLRPLLENESATWRDYHLLEKFMNVKRDVNTHEIINKKDFYYAMGIEDGRYKYIYTRFNNKQMNDRFAGPRFIDLKADPFEEKNLFGDKAYQELITQYHNKLRGVLEVHKFEFIKEYVDDPWCER